MKIRRGYVQHKGAWMKIHAHFIILKSPRMKIQRGYVQHTGGADENTCPFHTLKMCSDEIPKALLNHKIYMDKNPNAISQFPVLVLSNNPIHPPKNKP